jgi:hypothetical protein
MCVAGLQKFFLHGICREIMVPFHDNGFIAFGDDDVIPEGFDVLDFSDIGCTTQISCRIRSGIKFQVSSFKTRINL